MTRTRTRTKRTLPPRVALALYIHNLSPGFPSSWYSGIWFFWYMVFWFSGFLTVAHPASDELVTFSCTLCQTPSSSWGKVRNPNLKVQKGPFSNKPKVPLRGAGGLHHVRVLHPFFPNRKPLVRPPLAPHVATAIKMQQLPSLPESPGSSNEPPLSLAFPLLSLL